MDELKKVVDSNEKRITKIEIDIVKLNGKIDNLNQLTTTLDKLADAVNELNLAGVSNDNNFKVVYGKLDDINLKLEKSDKRYDELSKQRNEDHEKKPLEVFIKISWVIINAVLLYLLAKLGIR